MIKLQDLTPNVYYEQSRDFQFIGRLYDIILNYVKTSSDNLYNLPIGNNMDEKLLNLLATTLGFKAKHHYNSKHLEAICSVLPRILRNKGSINAIHEAVNALLHAEAISQTLDYSIDDEKSIVLYLPEQLTDLTLLQDLLEYILPAGMGCSMVKEIRKDVPVLTEITSVDTVTIYKEWAAQDRPFGRLLQLNHSVTKNEKGDNINVPSEDAVALVNGGPNGKAGLLPNIILYTEGQYDEIESEEETNEGD